MTPGPRIAVVILSYKRKDLLADCLRSVERHTDIGRHHVVVVDNASDDGSAEMVERDFPWVQVVRNKENAGFAGGVNRGMDHVRASGYVLLNSDARVQAGWLDRLIATAWSAPDVGIVSAMEVNEDGTARWDGPEAHVPAAQRPVIPMDRLSFACALIRREVVERIGYLDHGYFMYHEDWDYCHRAQAAGFRLLFDPTVEVVHPGGASFTTQAQAWRTRVRTTSRLRYQFTHWSAGRLLRSSWKEVRIFGYWVKEGNGRAYLQGWRAFARSWPDVRARRRDPAAFVKAEP